MTVQLSFLNSVIKELIRSLKDHIKTIHNGIATKITAIIHQGYQLLSPMQRRLQDDANKVFHNDQCLMLH